MLDDTIVTDEERVEFLNRQGWKTATESEQEALKSEWTDIKIRMAIDLGLA